MLEPNTHETMPNLAVWNPDTLLANLNITVPILPTEPQNMETSVVVAGENQREQNAQVARGERVVNRVSTLLTSLKEQALISGVSAIIWQFRSNPESPTQYVLEDTRYLDENDHELPIAPPANVAFQVLQERLRTHLLGTPGGTLSLAGRWIWSLNRDTVISQGPVIDVQVALTNWYRENPQTHPLYRERSRISEAPYVPPVPDYDSLGEDDIDDDPQGY